MPLTMVTVGEEKTIVDYRGKEEVKKHLTNLGFLKGETVQVLGSNQSGLILLVKGVRIALNKGLATKIVVA
ncbi:FeoA family protein [[Clostridium] polysaccharolyticum]|uniref:Ferrous iron transport protein A n=1 Tax=[Clostridium] polysaccharolyticum TaxID=29364 RepID=A0A1H9YWC6_9FIRM|nr:FeoA family protein [[Clostridium] polysaccharolyticum]SES73449.1 ferrous iron transport protein A [[Clostridium] polysaccharolyticum]